jgi:hypothetical protein
MSSIVNESMPASTDGEQDAEKRRSSDDVQRHRDIDREAQEIDPTAEKRVVRK